jgi:hypothetical protein
MFDVLLCLISGRGIRSSGTYSSGRRARTRPLEINLLCQESFDKGKSILPLMHYLPISLYHCLSLDYGLGIKLHGEHERDRINYYFDQKIWGK